MAKVIEIKDGILRTDAGEVYFSPFEERLVEVLLAGRPTDRLISLDQLITSLYQYPRDEPDGAEDSVKTLLSRIRMKLPQAGLSLSSSRGHGRGYRIEDNE